MSKLASVGLLINQAKHAVDQFQGREAAMVATKLDEARLWFEELRRVTTAKDGTTELARLQEREEQIKHGYPVQQPNGIGTSFYDKRTGLQVTDTVAIRELMRRHGVSGIGASPAP